MPNETLKQLKQITNSDDYDQESSLLVNRLAEKWDLAEAADNLSQHLVIKSFVQELTDQIVAIDEMLKNQNVVNDESIKYRFKLRADRESFDKFVSIFDGRAKKTLEVQINDFKNKADNLG